MFKDLAQIQVMVYLLLLLELLLMGFIMYRRKLKYAEQVRLINPKNEDVNAHNLVKTGKTSRLHRVRSKYVSSMVLILAFGLVAVCCTMFYHSHQIIVKHREDGLITQGHHNHDAKNRSVVEI